jgi:hypothetical protein
VRKSLTFLLTTLLLACVSSADESKDKLTHAIGSSQNCTGDEVANLANETQIDSDILVAMINQKCDDLVGKLIKDKKIKDAELLKASSALLKTNKDLVVPELERILKEKDYSAVEVIEANRVGLSIAFGQVFGKISCQHGLKLGCENEKQFNILDKKAEQLFTKIGAAKSAKEKNADPVLDSSVCELLQSKKEQETSIANQKEIAKESGGIVDKSVIYEAAHNLVNIKKQLEPYAKDFRKNRHKELNLKYCPEKYQY